MASWNDIDDILVDLTGALTTFDWPETSSICDRLTDRIRRTAELLPTQASTRLLESLRRKRRFHDLKRVADALIQSGQEDHGVVRRYAQGLIDMGELSAAKGVLEPILEGPQRGEAFGLLGRMYKQLYVDAEQPGNSRQRENLHRSVRNYLAGRAHDELWCSINVVALLSRARADGVSLEPDVDQDEVALAKQVLQTAIANRSDGRCNLWNLAVELEANVALARWGDALAAADAYCADTCADAFEFASTLRQLTEVWRIPADGGPSGAVIALLRGAIVRHAGGEVSFSAREVGALRQANFSDERRRLLQWWETGLDRCNGIARIESRTGRKVGSGFLVDPADFDVQGTEGPLLLTNWHVISAGGRFKDSVRPQDAVVRFESLHEVVKVRGIRRGSESLDACLVELDAMDPRGSECPRRTPPLEFDRAAPQRVYVIGYPSGGDLSFSIHDSHWLDTDDTHLHYRTPTEPGSSGSPVFDQDDWKVVALHCAGGQRVARLHGKKGTYEANVGVAIDAIQAAFVTDGSAAD